MPYDNETDPITNAVLALQAAGWEIADATRDDVTMKHPASTGDSTIVLELGDWS